MFRKELVVWSRNRKILLLSNGVAKLGVARQHLVQKKALFFFKNQVFRSSSISELRNYFSFGKKFWKTTIIIYLMFLNEFWSFLLSGIAVNRRIVLRIRSHNGKKILKKWRKSCNISSIFSGFSYPLLTPDLQYGYIGYPLCRI